MPIDAVDFNYVRKLVREQSAIVLDDLIPNLDDYLWNTQTEVCGYTSKNKRCSRKLQLVFFHNRSSGFGIKAYLVEARLAPLVRRQGCTSIRELLQGLRDRPPNRLHRQRR